MKTKEINKSNEEIVHITFVDSNSEKHFDLKESEIYQWLISMRSLTTYNDIKEELKRRVVAIQPLTHNGVYFLKAERIK